MVLLPKDTSRTVRAVYEMHEGKSQEWDSIGIGISVMGNECGRALWYNLRWPIPPKNFDGRMLRLFQTGHLEESRLLDELRSIGCVVTDLAEDGRQIKVYALGDHIRGKLDAEALGIPDAPKTIHVVECKSHNQKSFAALEKKGVKEAKPDHFMQTQIYMHLRKRKRGLYLAVNKNDDSLHSERLYHDPAFCEAAINRVASAIFSPQPPARAHENINARAAFKCKFCDFKGVCHEGAFARINCRTCIHSTPKRTGGWWCEKFNKKLTTEAQKKGCTEHLFIPDLVPGEQVDVNDDEGWVEYHMPDGTVWRDGTADKYRLASVGGA